MTRHRATRTIGYVPPPAAPTIIWVRNLAEMALAGYNINTPQAIHTDLKNKDCLKVPTTTPMLNTLVAGWNNGCESIFQSQGQVRTYIPFADYKIRPAKDIAIIAGESIHPLTASDGELLQNCPTGADIMNELLRVARFTSTADQLEMAISRHLLNCDNNELPVEFDETTSNTGAKSQPPPENFLTPCGKMSTPPPQKKKRFQPSLKIS